MKGIITMLFSIMIIVGTSVNAQSKEIEKLKEKKEKYDKQAKELKEKGKKYDKMSPEEKADYDAKKAEIEALQKQVKDRKEETMDSKGEAKHKGHEIGKGHDEHGNGKGKGHDKHEHGDHEHGDHEHGDHDRVKKPNERPGTESKPERPGVENRPERPGSEPSVGIGERPSNKEVMEAKERWEKESEEREVKIKKRTSQTQERISAIDTKIELAKRRLGAKRAKNEISEEEYQLKMGRVDQMETKLRSLRERNAEKATLMEQVKTNSDAILKK